MERIFSSSWFIYGLISVIVLDVLSLFIYTFPSVSYIALVCIIFGVVWALLKDIRWALWIPIVELAWGSFGSALSWNIFGFPLSLRMLIFVLVIAIWGIEFLMKRTQLKASYIWITSYVLLWIPVLWATIIGFFMGHPLQLIYDDANAYIFMLYLPIWISVFRLKDMRIVASLLAAAAIGLSIKTIVLFNVFANEYFLANLTYLYIWVRDTRIGEITRVTDSVWRIFIQSQVYIALYLVWAVVYLFTRSLPRLSWYAKFFPVLLMAAVGISLSRSYWLGIVGALGIAAIMFFPYLLKRWSITLNTIVLIFGNALIATGIIILTATSFTGDVSQTFLDRIIDSGSEAAGVSRLHLLPPLSAAIATHPVIGSGFGQTVTYESSDPRYKTPLNPTGTITTNAFEWGYFDQILEMGIIAFAVFFSAILFFIKKSITLVKNTTRYRSQIVALNIGLIFFIIVHIVSPYLNHPLGLGYVMLYIAAITNIYSEVYGTAFS